MKIFTMAVVGLLVAIQLALVVNAKTNTLTLATYAREGKPIPLSIALQGQLAGPNEKFELALMPTAGGVDNVRAIRDKTAHLAFVNASVAYEANWGFGAFVQAPVSVRAIAAMYPHSLHVVVRRESSIKTFADLKGKRVSIGARGSGSEQIATRLLTAAKIDVGTEIDAQSLSLSDSIRALSEQRIDAFIFGSAAPVDAIAKLASTVPVRFLESAGMVDELNRRHGRLYAKGTIPANTYVGQTEAVSSLDVWDLLVVSESVSVDVAYRLAKAVNEGRRALGGALPSALDVSPQRHADAIPIALHLGAQLYLGEIGVAPFNRLFRVDTRGPLRERSLPPLARGVIDVSQRDVAASR